MAKLKDRIWDFSLAALSAAILLLVPTGRWLQNSLTNFASSNPGVWNFILAISVFASVAVAAWYYFRLFRLSYIITGAHLFISLLLLGCAWVFLHTAVEYAHIPLYGSLGILSRISRRSRRGALGFCLILSLVDELLQGLHPARVFDLKDLVLNAVSSVYAIVSFEAAQPGILRETWKLSPTSSSLLTNGKLPTN